MPLRLALVVLASPAWLAGCSGSVSAPPEASNASAPPALARPTESGGAAPDRLALLVGIDRYAGGKEPIEPLAGSVNDVRRVEQLLVERFAFAPEAVLVLTDEEATHAGIVTAFDRWLIRGAGPETEVLFWFSGHGSRAPDEDGVEQDGLDSTYVAHDSRAGGHAGDYDISDDELRSLVSALGKRTRRIAVVTDACHSGAGLRGSPALRARSLPPGTRALDRELLAAFWPADVELLGDAQRPPETRDPFVHVAACANRQLAHEVALDLGSEAPAVHGALTAYLTLALEGARPGATWRELAQEAGVRLATHVPAQTVWYEGDVDRRLFDARFEEPPAGHAARVLDAQKVLVEAGALHGLREGTELELFAVGRSEPVGRAEVVHVRGVRSNARWLAPAPSSVPSGALRAVERSRPAGCAPLRVRAEDETLAAWIRASTSAAPSDAGFEYELLRTPVGLELRTAEGLVIAGWDVAAEGDLAPLQLELERELAEELRFRALWALAETPGSLQLAARFRAPTAKELERFPDFRSADPTPGTTAAHAIGGRAGDQRLALLEVENTTSEELHVAVLSLAEDRGRNLIFPPPFERDHVLAPGRTLSIPVGVQWWERWNLERPLRDRYLVIATKGYADFQACERGRELRGAPGDMGDLPELLALALAPVRTRGGPAASIDTTGWGVTTVDLLVRAP